MYETRSYHTIFDNKAFYEGFVTRNRFNAYDLAQKNQTNIILYGD